MAISQPDIIRFWRQQDVIVFVVKQRRLSKYVQTVFNNCTKAMQND